MPASTTALLENPDLLVVLPMLYVAWADGDLTSAELQVIETKVDALPFVTPKGKAALAPWLNPKAPPSATEMAHLLRELSGRARNLPPKHRESLVALGTAVAESSDLTTPEIREEERTALADIECALGVDCAEAVSSVLELDVDLPIERLEGVAFDGQQLAVLEALLDGPQHPLKQRVRTWLAARPPYEHELPSARYREHVLDRMRELSEAGLTQLAYPGITTPEEDLRPFIAVFETLGMGDLSVLVKFGVQFGLYGGSLYFLGTRRHQAWLDDVAHVRRLGCFAMTESGHGSNVQGLRTTAHYDEASEGFRIHTPDDGAHKEWIGNAACHAREAVVFCQLHVGGDNHGVHAIVVPIRDEAGQALPGVRIEDSGHKLGLNGVDNGRLWFDGVTVPRQNLLDRFATVTPEGLYESTIPSKSRRFFTTLGALVGGRVCVGSAAVTASKVGLATAVRYSARRRQFGPGQGEEVPIIEYRSQRMRLIPRLCTVYALSFTGQHLADRFAKRSERDQREIESFAAGFKAYATEHCIETLQVCRESCGGQGYASRNRFAALKADTDVFTTFEGDNTVLWQLVAKSVLSDFKRQFAEDRVFNMLRYLAQNATRSVSERNPFRVRNTGPQHLRSDEFLRKALRFREEDEISSAASRLNRRIKAGMDTFQAFLECQVHLIDMARAHTERIVYECFANAIAAGDVQNTMPDVAPYLDKMRALFGLAAIERDKGWFLENDYVETSKAKAIRKQVQILADELAPAAVSLVDAFAIPPAWMAHIATDRPETEPRG